MAPKGITLNILNKKLLIRTLDLKILNDIFQYKVLLVYRPNGLLKERPILTKPILKVAKARNKFLKEKNKIS